MTRAPAPVTLVGYVAPAPASPETTAKQVCWLWESPEGHAGWVAFTGSYWRVEAWGEITPVEHQALKRAAARGAPCLATWLGPDPTAAACARWWPQRPSTPATAAQLAFLARLGAPPPPGLPKLVAGAVIDVCRLARAVLRDDQIARHYPADCPQELQTALPDLLHAGHDLLAYLQALRAVQAALDAAPSKPLPVACTLPSDPAKGTS